MSSGPSSGSGIRSLVWPLPPGATPAPRMYGPPRPDARRLGSTADTLFLRAMSQHPLSGMNIAWDDHLEHWANVDACKAKVVRPFKLPLKKK